MTGEGSAPCGQLGEPVQGKEGDSDLARRKSQGDSACQSSWREVSGAAEAGQGLWVEPPALADSTQSVHSPGGGGTSQDRRLPLNVPGGH